MSANSLKLEIIDWILHINDNVLIKDLEKYLENKQALPKHKREFGCGKNIFSYISEDFDEPLKDFKPYMK